MRYFLGILAGDETVRGGGILGAVERGLLAWEEQEEETDGRRSRSFLLGQDNG
jgi:hypothetical protein